MVKARWRIRIPVAHAVSFERWGRQGQLQQQDFWYMITPPTVTQIQGYSDIEERTVNYEWLLLDMEKPWLKRN
jgi:hypothetical protein